MKENGVDTAILDMDPSKPLPSEQPEDPDGEDYETVEDEADEVALAAGGAAAGGQLFGVGGDAEKQALNMAIAIYSHMGGARLDAIGGPDALGALEELRAVEKTDGRVLSLEQRKDGGLVGVLGEARRRIGLDVRLWLRRILRHALGDRRREHVAQELVKGVHSAKSRLDDGEEPLGLARLEAPRTSSAPLRTVTSIVSVRPLGQARRRAWLPAAACAYLKTLL